MAEHTVPELEILLPVHNEGESIEATLREIYSVIGASVPMRFIVCEDAYDSSVEEFIVANGYAVRAVLSAQKHTRDILYEALRDQA